MKKILISKFHDRSPSPPPKLSPSNTAATKDNVNFQPPLPPGPPPQDLQILQIKKEVIDEGYQSLSSDSSPESEPPIIEETIKKEVLDTRPMCKRFLRGTCTKGDSCIYKHEIVLSELKGQLKFCWDFQNKMCERPICTHVHASVFEEQHFYRTGYLPPKALAHLQKNDGKKTNTFDVKFSNSQPSNGVSSKLHYTTPTNMKYGKINADIKNMEYETKKTKSLKRSWSDITEICSGNPDNHKGEPFAKKCKHCDVNLFRVEMTSNDLKDIICSTLKLKESVVDLDGKRTRLNYVTNALKALANDNSLDKFMGSMVKENLDVGGEKITEVAEAVNIILMLQNAVVP